MDSRAGLPKLSARAPGSAQTSTGTPSALQRTAIGAGAGNGLPGAWRVHAALRGHRYERREQREVFDLEPVRRAEVGDGREHAAHVDRAHDGADAELGRQR